MNDETIRQRASLRRDYEDYLRRQRGLSERTIGHCWRFADHFLYTGGTMALVCGSMRPSACAASVRGFQGVEFSFMSSL